ncbi:peptidase domain-containing ABC transporter [Massilia putida]|uniref:peptidase domain-containing ABC transporter n=1 Tax=Massilia putida TaxID=1141883 RepID=UPI000AEF103D|nr:peptidase domain-containing ABC transporter [Massilia putida]
MKIASSLQLAFWSTKRLPVILQTEAAECGLACIAMVTSYWGHRIDLSTMRQRFCISLKGATLKGLMAMAQGLNLQPRPLKLEMEHLPQLRLPAILHWDMNHFVVLRGVTNTHAYIHDPGVGERRLLLIDVAKHFTGVALELTPTSEFLPKNERRDFSLLSLMGRVVGLRRSLGQVLLLGLALQVCALIAPFYMQWVVDEALLAADHEMMTVLGCGFLLLVMLQTSIAAVRSWVTTILSTNINFQWLGNAFTHLMKLPLPYFENRHTGDIVSRFNSIQAMQKSLTIQFVEGVIDGVLVLGTFVLMCLYSFKLAAIACCAVGLYISLRVLIFAPLKNATSEQIIHSAKQQTHFLESVRGVQSVRLFCRNDERCASWLNALADQFNSELRIARLGLSYQAASNFLFGAERIIVIWIAVLAVMDAKFSIGMLFAFISYKDQFSQRIVSLVDKLFEFKMLRLHGERVADIVLTQTEKINCNYEIDPLDIIPSIELRRISFRYADGEPYIIKDLDIKISPGECIALTGASGSGKTTLMKLILGLLEPTNGEILIGGVKVANLGLANYRQMIGTVMQDDMLFAGSISDNISFFSSNPNQEQVVQCARLAAIDVEIMSMPMAYNTLVGDIGTGLSGVRSSGFCSLGRCIKTHKFLFWTKQPVTSTYGMNRQSTLRYKTLS